MQTTLAQAWGQAVPNMNDRIQVKNMNKMITKNFNLECKYTVWLITKPQLKFSTLKTYFHTTNIHCIFMY